MSPTKTTKKRKKVSKFQRQKKICQQLNLNLIGKVYQSWRPPKQISKKVTKSTALKAISSLAILKAAINFLQQHQRVTVRQIYYALVSRQIINNNMNEYRRLCNIVKQGRLAGLLPFNSIIDDTRSAQKTYSWPSIEALIDYYIDNYRSDWWVDQDKYVEVWLEKRALRRIFYPITNRYDVHLCIGGGYQSWSTIWKAKKRFDARSEQDRLILYFGDLDPSGKDMARDLRDRFSLLNVNVAIYEIALTKHDVLQYNLPRNPSKPKDTRKAWFVNKYGINYAVELDALSPNILEQKIQTAIENVADMDDLRDKQQHDEWEKTKWRQRLSLS